VSAPESVSPTAPASAKASAPATGTLGLILPTFPQDGADLPGAAALATLCRGAEAGGAGTLWACDHLFWHGPALEALSVLGVAAGATTRAAIGTCVLQLPLRHAPSVAKEAAALAHLSGGRFVLGVGVGTHPGEYAAAGMEFTGRGKRLDNGIDTLRRTWAASAGERYAQLPVAEPIPIWVGGSSEAALRRAAQRGDGWIPLFVPPGEYAAALDRLDKEADRVGRDPAAIARAAVVFVSPGDSAVEERGLSWMASLYGLPGHSFARHLVVGNARRCATALMRFAEAGAQHVAVFVTSDDPLVQFEDLAGEFAGVIACPVDPTEASTVDRARGAPEPTASTPAGVGEVVPTSGARQFEAQVWR
jgi:alkanesulfonate monooxygenase SsuD/methylene tetrahydromethanopterin reductase-like flavin-dependent oxidoreductase (luciferase family)